MRYPASEKLEIIRLVEGSALPVRRTLEKIGIARATFYRWYAPPRQNSVRRRCSAQPIPSATTRARRVRV